MDYEREDRIALIRALESLHVCPRCRHSMPPRARQTHQCPRPTKAEIGTAMADGLAEATEP